MPFDQYICAETPTDIIKMESVRQYHMKAIEKILAGPDYDGRQKIIGALEYSLLYIERCQATFTHNQNKITDLHLTNEKLSLQNENLKGQVSQLEKIIKELKVWNQ